MQASNESYTATLHAGKITLSSRKEQERTVFSFPRREHPHPVTCMELVLDFLIFGTSAGAIFHYLLDSEAGPQCVGSHTHRAAAIKRVWSNSLGTRLVFEDDSKALHLHNPVDQQTLAICEVHDCDCVLWDVEDSHVLCISRGCDDYVYTYHPVSTCSSQLIFMGSSMRPASLYPVALQGGVLTCQVENDRLEDVTLDTHKWIKGQNEADLKLKFTQNLSLLRFKEAWNDAVSLKSNEAWDMLVKSALEKMELDLALRACHQAKNLKLLMSLRPLENIEDRYLLGGHITALFGDYDVAEKLLLVSSSPESAVALRMNLQQWDKALALAMEVGSGSIHEIKWRYARLMERRGEYRQSLAQYQDALLACSPGSPRYFEIKAGIARTLIHVGDIWKGKQITLECDNRNLYGDCARILESLNLLQDAAELYEHGLQLEKAASLYIQVKNFQRARVLLDHLKSCKLYVEYAKALEAEHKLLDASAAFEAAEDVENVVRLELGQLKNPTKAYSVLRETKSIAGALVAVKFCKSSGDYDRAIEFLIMAKRTQEAHELAQLHGKMDSYTKLALDVASREECLKLARYYETSANYTQAGVLFERCNDPKHALDLYLQWGSSEGMDQAIALVVRLKEETLTSQLFEFLLDESRVEKSQRHLFALYTALGRIDDATSAAKVVANQDQEAGNYKSAHHLLLHHIKTLRACDKQVPGELLIQLMLLHSYILVKTLIRLDDHSSSARMLIRIVHNISKFPAHVVQILTSAVIECQRSSLKKSAFEYASMLMNPDYRQLISPVYKRKIEKIVRKPEKVEEEEALSPCPRCLLPIPETQLECPACGTNIPFCIATGRHMVRDNWAECPCCKFPALMTELKKILEAERACPMCHELVSPEDLQALSEPSF